MKALIWAKQYSYISDLAIKVILNARNTVLFDGKDFWTKKGNSKFDVGMGSYDGAECCEIVGLYALYVITCEKAILPAEDAVLYRDDGLAAVQGSARDIDRKRKKLISAFKEMGLHITCISNVKQVSFLDVCLDLNNELFKPYVKKNSKIQYVAKGSNHPNNILNNIPLNVNRRLQSISSNKKCFETDLHVYQNAIKEAGYDINLNYDRTYDKPRRYNNIQAPRLDPNTKVNRRRNVTWFNPPFNLFCATKVGRKFRDLIEKHFSKGNLIGKLFNKNKLKISYSCVGNLKSKFSAHYRKVLNSEGAQKSGGCNCQDKNNCPMGGQCIQKDIVYRAEVCKFGEPRGQGKLYVGLASGLWKLRFATHKGSFNNEARKKDTELSKYIWSLKDNNTIMRLGKKTQSFLNMFGV